MLVKGEAGFGRTRAVVDDYGAFAGVRCALSVSLWLRWLPASEWIIRRRIDSWAKLPVWWRSGQSSLHDYLSRRIDSHLVLECGRSSDGVRCMGKSTQEVQHLRLIRIEKGVVLI
jgi:hypothetical protein